jgi:hypothetical protein
MLQDSLCGEHTSEQSVSIEGREFPERLFASEEELVAI